jgi:hypothetical protein
VDYQEVGLGGDGSLEQLYARGDAAGELADLAFARELEAVGAVVLEALWLEEGVQLGDGVLRLVGGEALGVGYCGLRRGVAQPGSARRSGRRGPRFESGRPDVRKPPCSRGFSGF